MNERERERREGERRILETDLLMMVPFPYIITACINAVLILCIM